MKYIVGMAIILSLWVLMRNWQQVQRLKIRQQRAKDIDERFAQAKANLDIAYANRHFDEGEYRIRLLLLRQQCQEEKMRL